MLPGSLARPRPEWARTALADKNRLTTEDAKFAEDAFAQRLAELAEAAPENAAEDPLPAPSARTSDQPTLRSVILPQRRVIASTASILSRIASATRRTCALLPSSRVSFAVVSPQSPIISGPHSRGRSGAKRATSSPSRSVACTTGKR